MGISGLLPVLASITSNVHISELRGKRVAVDAYVWLHRGAYACSMELAQRIPTNKYISYCLHRVRLLQHHGVIPILVFDGAPLPAKRETNRKRGEYVVGRERRHIIHDRTLDHRHWHWCWRWLV
jgi:exonuclease 1